MNCASLCIKSVCSGVFSWYFSKGVLGIFKNGGSKTLEADGFVNIYAIYWSV